MEFVEIVLVHAGERSVLSLLELLHCGRASRRWREAVLGSLPTLRALDFRGCETRITEPGVLAVLAECLPSTFPTAGCSAPRTWNRSWHAWPRRARVLRRSTSEGCGEAAQLRAPAVRASALYDAASPRALFEFIAALSEGGDARCPLERLLSLLSQGQPPFLVLDLVPRQHALQDAAGAHGERREG